MATTLGRALLVVLAVGAMLFVAQSLRAIDLQQRGAATAARLGPRPDPSAVAAAASDFRRASRLNVDPTPDLDRQPSWFAPATLAPLLGRSKMSCGTTRGPCAGGRCWRRRRRPSTSGGRRWPTLNCWTSTAGVRACRSLGASCRLLTAAGSGSSPVACPASSRGQRSPEVPCRSTAGRPRRLTGRRPSSSSWSRGDGSWRPCRRRSGARTSHAATASASSSRGSGSAFRSTGSSGRPAQREGLRRGG